MARTLNPPRPARVRWGERFPVEVNGETIESLRESWLVEDRWWTGVPLRRRYWELLGSRGRNMVVFHDLAAGAREAHSPCGLELEGRRGGRRAWFVQNP